MATHAVSKDTHAIAIQLLEALKESFRQLVFDIAVHAVPSAPWLLSCINIEARAGAEVIGVILAGKFQTTCQSV